jgi:lysophospholipase L1-like esterase
MNQAFTILSLILAACLSAAALPPDQPEASSDRYWIREHLRIKNLIKEAPPPRTPGLYFLGDSITAFWPETGKDSWQAMTGKIQTFNAAISGDTTQNILWRINNGAFENIHPEVIILLAGINNLGLSPELGAEDLSRGIRAIVSTLHRKSPSSRILVLSILPSSTAEDPVRQRILDTNALLSTLADRRKVYYLDLHTAFLDQHRNLLPNLLTDGTHPSAAGYRLMARLLAPVLEECKGGG